MRPPLFLLPALLCAATMAQGVSLSEIPELARKRLEAQRQRVLALLEPYMEDLLLDGNSQENRRYLEPKLDEIAALGDSVLPILLELLTPDEDTGEKRAMASNCAKILGRMQPARLVPELIVLVRGKDPQGRLHAIDLLGQSDDPRAAKAITDIFANLRGDPLTRSLRALGRLGSADAAKLAVKHLSSNDARLRRRVLTYLRLSQATLVVDQVLEHLAGESSLDLQPTYIRYFSEVVHDNAMVAEVLAPMLLSVELGRGDLHTLAQALGQIAPPGHRASIDALLALLENGSYDRLGIAAALSLRELGEDKGERILFSQLDRRLRKARDSGNRYADRAEAHFAFADWRKAKRDFELAIRHTRANPSRSLYLLRVAHCEAHMGKPRSLVNALRNSGIGLATIMAEAEKDRVFAEALQDPVVKKYLGSLKPKNGQP